MGSKGKILIVEDDHLLRSSINSLLLNEGYEVISVCDGNSAMDIVRNNDFDSIVIDIMLPGGMNGIEVMSKIKEMRDKVIPPFILITGHSEEHYTTKAIKLGVFDYILKPFEIEELLRSIDISVKNYKLDREKERFLYEREKKYGYLEEYSVRLEREVKEKTKELSLLLEIGREIASSLNLEEVLNTIVEQIANVLEVEICSILLFDEEKEALFIAAAKGLPEEIVKNTRIRKGERISGTIIETRKPILVEDIEKDTRFGKVTSERYYTGSFISVPMIFKDRLIGVINVNNKRSKEVFTGEDLRLMEGIADYAGLAIENARLYSDLKEVYMEIISALTFIIEMKDHYTRGHSERVTKYAVRIAQAKGLSLSSIEYIRLACHLHDLGKIGIDGSLLIKPENLNDREWDEIKLHPQKGVEIIKPLSFLKDVMELIIQHHERYDGKGYPRGKFAEEIDLGARIIAVADSFDAMTTDRPYRKALTLEGAIEELKACRGTQFDPEIVDIFIKLLQEDHALFEK
ncbi:MAG: response regulator [Candidatus Omnitrophica bacterium]|nr:response regulator [Candidatus Omnitrophota bacterium]